VTRSQPSNERALGRRKEAFVLGNSGGGSSTPRPGVGMAGAAQLPGQHPGPRLPRKEASGQTGPWPRASWALALLLVRGRCPWPLRRKLRQHQREEGREKMGSAAFFRSTTNWPLAARIWEYRWERSSPSHEEQMTFLSWWICSQVSPKHTKGHTARCSQPV